MPSIMDGYRFQHILESNFDMWHNQKLPRGILIKFWRKNLKINYLHRWVGR